MIIDKQSNVGKILKCSHRLWIWHVLSDGYLPFTCDHKSMRRRVLFATFVMIEMMIACFKVWDAKC
jgi:hypothetical protein